MLVTPEEKLVAAAVICAYCSPSARWSSTPVIVKVVEVWPAGITTDGGTVACVVLPLPRSTVSAWLVPVLRVTVATVDPLAEIAATGSDMDNAGPLESSTVNWVVTELFPRVTPPVETNWAVMSAY
jgi:hypothetical protein